MNFKKNLLIGLLSGAIIFSGGQAFANEPDMPDDDWQAHEQADVSFMAGEVSKDITRRFLLDENRCRKIWRRRVASQSGD